MYKYQLYHWWFDSFFWQCTRLLYSFVSNRLFLRYSPIYYLNRFSFVLLFEKRQKSNIFKRRKNISTYDSWVALTPRFPIVLHFENKIRNEHSIVICHCKEIKLDERMELIINIFMLIQIKKDIWKENSYEIWFNLKKKCIVWNYLQYFFAKNAFQSVSSSRLFERVLRTVEQKRSV